MGLDPDTFAKLFPFHFSVDLDFRVLQVGEALCQMLPRLSQPGTHIGEVLKASQDADQAYLSSYLSNSTQVLGSLPLPGTPSLLAIYIRCYVHTFSPTAGCLPT